MYDRDPNYAFHVYNSCTLWNGILSQLTCMNMHFCHSDISCIISLDHFHIAHYIFVVAGEMLSCKFGTQTTDQIVLFIYSNSGNCPVLNFKHIVSQGSLRFKEALLFFFFFFFLGGGRSGRGSHTCRCYNLV